MSESLSETSVRMDSNEKMTFATACVFIVGEVAGGGILSLPRSSAQAGWAGLGLVAYCALAAAIAGICLARCWLLLEERYPQYRHGLTRKPFATIGGHAFGRWTSTTVSVLINVTRIGSGTVFILLTSSLIHSLTAQWIPLTQCRWIPIMPLLYFLPFLLRSPADFWPIAYLATGSSLIGSLLLMVQMGRQIAANGLAPDLLHVPSVEEFSSGYGTILFAYSGAASFPNFQNDMKEKSKFPRAVMIGFATLVAIYVPIAGLGYASQGLHASSNTIDDLDPGPVVSVVRVCFLLHCFCVIFITVNPVLLDLEEWLHVPKSFSYKRVLLRSAILLIMTFLALTFPSFGEVLDLIGATTVVLLSFVLPIVFYVKLRYDGARTGKSGERSARLAGRARIKQCFIVAHSFIPVYQLALLAFLIVTDVLGGASSAYSTLRNWTSLQSACYLSNWNVTQA